MCFSAAASFTASAILGASGAACLAKTKQKKDLFVASIPFLFAIQQFAEGFVWLYPNHGLLTLIFSYIFLFFAFLLWPTYIPLVAWSNEVDPIRKKILRRLIWLGLLGSLSAILILITQPLSIGIVGHSIRYGISAPFQLFTLAMYLLVTVGALLISTHTFLRWFGFTSLLGAMVTWTVYQQAFTSVWCFFSAIFSIILVGYFFFRKKI